MKKKHYIYGVHVTERLKSAVDVQKVLTEYGCNIKTRIGLHDIIGEECSNTGLLIIELVGDDGKIQEMVVKLQQIKGVEVKGMIFDHAG